VKSNRISPSEVFRRTLFLLVCSYLFLPFPVQAQDVSYELENTSPWILGGGAALGVVLTVGTRLIVGEPAKDCKWCESNGFDKKGRSFFVIEPVSKEIGYISHGVTVGLVPALGLFGLIAPAMELGRGDHAIENTMMMVNAFIYTTAFAELAKGAADRKRPGVYYGRAHETQAGDFESERNRSFFSADTAWAFTLASSASTVSFMRGYSWAPYITAGTFGLAALGGSMRIMSDMHWPTDVLVGAVVGSAIGFFVPWILHNREPNQPDTMSAALEERTTMFQLQWQTR